MVEQEPIKIKSPDKITQLRREGGDVQAVVEQMFFDAYRSGRDDPELAYIGFQTLLDAGIHGQAAMQWMAQDTGNLGIQAKRVLDLGRMFDPVQYDSRVLEEIVHLRRYEELYEFDTHDDPSKNVEIMFRSIYRFAKRFKMITDLPYDFFCDQLAHEMLEKSDASLVSTAATFDVFEPVYFELLGSDGVMDLRDIEQPRALLLGSLGVHSARGFDRFCRKINPNIARRVIDIDSSLPNEVAQYYPECRAGIDIGTALHMPYPSSSVDHVYTNVLLHMLKEDGTKGVNQKMVKQLLDEVFRVLKPGGRFNLVERAYGTYQQSHYGEDTVSAKSEVISLALRTGFIVRKQEMKPKRFVLSGQQGTTCLSRNGVAYYPNALLHCSRQEFFALSLEKPSQTQ
ncbi:MAG: hypothetical protein ACD_43C00214G0004 [uncultured bacterium]|nr:MAG: hypothetical protein ACD_43C00214G0004 [uncultured bacterium]